MQTLAEAGPQTQKRSIVTVWSRLSPWSWMVIQYTPIYMALLAVRPMSTNMALDVGPYFKCFISEGKGIPTVRSQVIPIVA